MTGLAIIYAYAAFLHVLWFANHNPPKTRVEYGVVAAWAIFWPIAGIAAAIFMHVSREKVQ